jgi:ribosomal protein S18 acetylase RimI-like enzyme
VQKLTLADTDWTGIAQAYNVVYEGYVMPFNVTAEWAEQHVTRLRIDREQSPLWIDDHGNVIAMAALAVLGRRGWVGGFGVSREYRGQGLGHTLLASVLAAARKLRLQSVQLEVFTTNTAAIRTYERGGFVHQRDLLILRRDAGPMQVDVDVTLARPADPRMLLAARKRVGSPPDWAREPENLVHVDDLQGLVVGNEDAPLALALYRVVDGTPRLHDVAALDLSAAHAVVAALVARFPKQQLLLVNEPEGSSALPALLDAGWVETAQQHELVLALPAPPVE